MGTDKLHNDKMINGLSHYQPTVDMPSGIANMPGGNTDMPSAGPKPVKPPELLYANDKNNGERKMFELLAINQFHKNKNNNNNSNNKNQSSSENEDWPREVRI